MQDRRIGEMLESRLIRSHQAEIRAELYTGVREALGNEVDGPIGRRVILPSAFIGGARHMQ